MIDDGHELWRIAEVRCVMVSCCSGAELQVRRGDEVLLRELYPAKHDLFQRARELRSEYERAWGNADRRQ
jgi:hypothetical protein